MAPYDDYRLSSSILESPRDGPRHSRERLHSRGPPVRERPRPAFDYDERFESRLHAADRYGPPARRPDRYYDDADSFVSSERPERRRGVSPPPRPRLLRRQSSLDTFDRIPSRKLEEMYYRGPSPRLSPPPRSRYSPPRPHGDDLYYEDIRIAEPDYYGDEEFRGFRERDRYPTRPRRSSSRFRERIVEERIERPYPRKGKTRMPKKLVHPRAILDRGYPFEEEEKAVMIQVALSKEQIDELVTISREIRRVSEARIVRTSPSPVRMERLSIADSPPRASHDTLIVERSPSRSHSRHHRHRRGHSERTLSVSRTRSRSISAQSRRRRRSSPGRREANRDETGPLAIMVRPRDSDDDLKLVGPLERRSGDLTEDEEVHEVKKERKSPNSRLIRAMMATLT
ncbi:uncharacterized protein ASPGLDRAFT_528040 [Aspergillus glaucus CBS 516.65]|uniref:DUF8035 domain-containing protein n=1 Tax=Aspergillus glaucus CBS 516.65 TaxID=1160497 RepID=A0A1L9VEM3_ASPGL|nr:hypothetical protein ASPGLDRAFT_528040 [Aspergillus glaucus CBS 516.65]OJJ82343.1 hypothetical protein ASPGLDRAFT_528040 [Aspergillus glaucus CBS 516.65]